jgi:hypothetical protein
LMRSPSMVSYNGNGDLVIVKRSLKRLDQSANLHFFLFEDAALNL